MKDALKDAGGRATVSRGVAQTVRPGGEQQGEGDLISACNSLLGGAVQLGTGCLEVAVGVTAGAGPTRRRGGSRSDKWTRREAIRMGRISVGTSSTPSGRAPASLRGERGSIIVVGVVISIKDVGVLKPPGVEISPPRSPRALLPSPSRPGDIMSSSMSGACRSVSLLRVRKMMRVWVLRRGWVGMRVLDGLGGGPRVERWGRGEGVGRMGCGCRGRPLGGEGVDGGVVLRGIKRRAGGEGREGRGGG